MIMQERSQEIPAPLKPWRSQMTFSLILYREDGRELDEAILGLLRQAKQPLSASTISFLLNRPVRDICMTLNKMKKYSEVRKVTAKKIQFWEVVG